MGTLSPNLAMELQASGENLDTWGDPHLNNDLLRLDWAVKGVLSFTLSGTKTLTSGNDSSTNTALYENIVSCLNITSGSGGTVVVPSKAGQWVVINNTAGAVSISNNASAATVASGARTVVATDGVMVWRLTGDTVLAQPLLPLGRLTLQTGTPVPTSNITAATTVYYTPDRGGSVPILTTSGWTTVNIGELSLSLDSDNSHTGYHAANTGFDFFIISDSGVPRLVTGPAWAGANNRAAAISRMNGVRVNTTTMTVRFGTASGNTLSIPAGMATWVGAARMTSAGQTEDSVLKRFLWNAYNRVVRRLAVFDTTNNWTYSTAAYRQARASTANQVEVFIGEVTDLVELEVRVNTANSTVGQTAVVGVGVNSTVTTSAQLRNYAQTSVATYPQLAAASFSDYPTAIGYFYYAWLEYASGGTQTWQGSVAQGTAGMQGVCWA
jgi:hypothetical protein